MKKILCLILVIITVMSCSVFAKPVLHDLDECKSENDIVFLYNLGIIKGDENGYFNPQKDVSRIEFAVMLLRLMNLDVVNGGVAEDNFIDIPKGHWAYEEAYVLKTMGIVDGVSKTEFGADETVTYDQATKMLVSALGYKDVAESRGGYPNGYISVATELRLNVGVNPDGNIIKRDVAAAFIVNALEKQIRFVNVETNETPLVRHGIENYNGTVTSTYELQAAEEIDVDEISIDNVIYDMDTENCIFSTEELYGRNVEYFTKEIDREKVIIHIRTKGEIKSIKIEADDIQENSTVTTLYYEYGSKGKIESIKLQPDSLNAYFNGRLVTSNYVNAALMKPDEGYIVAYDMDKNGVYEIVQVVSYDTCVVSRIQGKTLYDRYNNNIDFSGYENVKVIDGEKILTLEEIPAGSIVSIQRDKEGTTANIFICKDYIDGTIKTLKRITDSSYEYGIITTNGVSDKYQLATVLKNAINGNSYNVGSINIGLEARFYLNISGKIAAFDTLASLEDDYKATEFGVSRTGLIYGFIWDAYLSTMGDLEIKVLTRNNKYEVFVTKNQENILFGRLSGGEYVRNKAMPSEVYNVIKGTKQLITYMLDEEGYLKELCLADSKINDSHLFKSTTLKKSLFNNKTFNGYYWVDQDTIVFALPEYMKYEDFNKVGRYNDILSDSASYTLDIYDVEDDGRIGAIVYDTEDIIEYTRASDGYEIFIDPTNSPIIYVEEVTEQMMDDEVRTVVKGWEDGRYVSRILADNLYSYSQDRSIVTPGAAIQYETNHIHAAKAVNSDEPEEIVLVKKIMNFNENNPKKTTYGYADTLLWRQVGAYTLDDDGLTVSYGDITGVTDAVISFRSNKYLSLLKDGRTMVLCYNKHAKTFSKRSIDDLVTGMEIYVRQRIINVIDIVYFE